MCYLILLSNSMAEGSSCEDMVVWHGYYDGLILVKCVLVGVIEIIY